jgi:type IV pilus assembly protein PilY1
MYFGTSDGQVYSMSFTGDASTDVGNVAQLGATEDGQPVQFVGYQQYKYQPYLWAASANVITVFGINNVGWNPLWASGPNTSYTYGGSGWTQVSSGTTPAPLQANATISDLPLVVNGVLVVPVYVPPSATAQACNIAGEGYYDFFALASGIFPKNQVEQNGTYLTGNLALGEGKAYSPSISISGSALPLYGSTQQTQSPQSPLLFSRSGLNTIVQWRVH